MMAFMFWLPSVRAKKRLNPTRPFLFFWDVSREMEIALGETSWDMICIYIYIHIHMYVYNVM